MGSKLTALTEISAPTLDDIMYIVDAPAGTPLSKKVSLSRLLGPLGLNQFRLTTESLVPVSGADRLAQGTIYLTPNVNAPSLSGAGPTAGTGLITLFDGQPRVYSSAQVQLALSGVTTGNHYDIFGFDNGGVVTLELGPAWTDPLTRSTNLVPTGNLLVKSGQTTRTYLGTLRGTGTNTTEDSGGGVTTQVGGKRFLWNYFNRVRRPILVTDLTAAAWSYATALWRIANGAAGNRVEVVVGIAMGDVISLRITTKLVTSAANVGGAVAIGVDSTTVASNLCVRNIAVSANSSQEPSVALLSIHPTIGYHNYNWLEAGLTGGGTISWGGFTAVGDTLPGMTGEHAC